MNSKHLKLLLIAVHIVMAVAPASAPAPAIPEFPRNVPLQIMDKDGDCLISFKILDPQVQFDLVNVPKGGCSYNGQEIPTPFGLATISTQWVFQSGYAAQNPGAVPKFAVVLMSSQGYCISPRFEDNGATIAVPLSTDLSLDFVRGVPCDKSLPYLRFKVTGLENSMVKFTNVEQGQALLSAGSEEFVISEIPVRRELETVQIPTTFLSKVNQTIVDWQKKNP